MLRDNGFLFAAALVVGLANYLLNITAARRFAPGEYSQFGVILNLLAAFAPISSSVLAAVMRGASFYDSRGEILRKDAMQRTLFGHLSLVYIAAFLLVLAFHTQIAHFLRLAVAVPLYFVVATAFCLFIQMLSQGVLQAEGRFGRIGAIYVGEAFFRGMVGIAAILLGMHITGVSAIYMLSAALAALCFPRPGKLWAGLRLSLREMRPVYRDVGQLMLTNLSLVLLINIDIVLCRRYLSPGVADQYVAISSMAKFFLFATTSVAVVAFTEFVKAIHEGSSLLRPLALSFGLVLVSGPLFVALCAVFGPLILALTFGETYRLSGGSLWIPALSAFAISLINVEAAYFNARKWFWYLPVLMFGSVVTIGALSLTHHHLQRYASIYALSAMALAVVLLVPLFLQVSGKTRRKDSVAAFSIECASIHTGTDVEPASGGRDE